MITVNEIKKRLVELGCEEIDLVGVKKGDLVKMLETAEAAHVQIDNAVEIKEPAMLIQDEPTVVDKLAEIQNDINKMNGQKNVVSMVDLTQSAPINENIKPDSDRPKFASPEWTAYVLNNLTEDEKDQNGNPKADGLRRVAWSLIGPFSNNSNVIQVPDPNNGMRATVSVTLKFDTGYDPIRSVTGSADCYSGNTDRAYAAHAVATAETRAEGRALRKALMLSRVNTAEEMAGASVDSPTGVDNGLADEGMVAGITQMTKALGIDLVKMVANEKFDVSSPKDINMIQAKRLMALISDYREGRQVVPECIKIS